ncbi:MAG: GNAT family N-acetyltransferase [Acidobacteriales bacterium]|nr:GNAT family N-acetyltransferase [Terriglobales bacterium]
MRVKIARSAAELEQFRSPWETLYSASHCALFQRFDWNLLAAQVFGTYEQPFVVFAEDGNGAAILPACVRNKTRTLSLMGEELFDYRDYLAAGDQAALTAAWKKLAELEQPFELTALRGHQASSRWAWMNPQIFCHAPGGTPDHPPQPKNMPALRRLLRSGAVIEQHRPGGELIGWIYEQKGRQNSNLFADPLRRTFMEAVAQLPGSRCEIFTLKLEAEILAALVTFVDGNCRRFYTTYFDERWAKRSPGYALLCEISQRTLAENLGYDFMTGEQLYKTRLASELVPLYRITLQKINFRRQEPVENLAAA